MSFNIWFHSEHFETAVINSTSLAALDICEVCGSYQCPYCPYYSGKAHPLHPCIPLLTLTILLTLLSPALTNSVRKKIILWERVAVIVMVVVVKLDDLELLTCPTKGFKSASFSCLVCLNRFPYRKNNRERERKEIKGNMNVFEVWLKNKKGVWSVC